MSDEEDTLVPTSSMSFEKQVIILRAYVVVTKMGTEPTHYKRIVTGTRYARTQISGVNSFFLGLGFLRTTGKGTYLPAKEVVEFCKGKRGEEDYSVLRPLVAASTLYTLVRGQVKIHGSVTQEETLNYLLDESGGAMKDRAQRSLEWLQRAGLIRISGDGDLELL